MRVYFKAGAKRVSLKSEGLTLLHYKESGLCYARKYFIPPQTEHNSMMGSVFKELANIWRLFLVETKEKWRIYADLYNQKERLGQSLLNGYACFTKLAFEFRKQNPELKLTSIDFHELSNLTGIEQLSDSGLGSINDEIKFETVFDTFIFVLKRIKCEVMEEFRKTPIMMLSAEMWIERTDHAP